jgi:amphi-Trp domain-containing protein
MAGKSVVYSSSERMSRSEYAGLLRRMADRIEEGRVEFETGDGGVSIEIPETVVVDVEVTEKAKKEGRKYDLEIEADWVEGAEESGGIRLT